MMYSISRKVEAIIFNFSHHGIQNPQYNPYIYLIVSLYAQSPYVDNEVLDKLDKYRINLSDFFTEDEIKLFNLEYDSIIQYCFHRKNDTSRTLIDNQNLSDLFDASIERNGNSKVFLPCVNEGLLMLSEIKSEYFGFEENPETWALLQIYIQSASLQAHIELGVWDVNGDRWKDIVYDYVYFLPSFFDRKYVYRMVEPIIQTLKYNMLDGGEMWCCVPREFGYGNGGDYRKLKDFLLRPDSEYSFHVYEFPKTLFNPVKYTYVLRLIKDYKREVVMVDAMDNNLWQWVSSRYVLNLEKIGKRIFLKSDQYHVWTGKTSDIKNNNIQPRRYIVGEIQKKLLNNKNTIRCRLSELVKIQYFHRIRNLQNQLPCVYKQDLSSNFSICDIEYKNIEKYNLERNVSVITQDCLIAVYNGDGMKVGRIKGLDKNHYCCVGIYLHPMKIISDKISEDYLLYALMSKDVRNQIRRLIDFDIADNALLGRDLLSVVIDLPSVKEQERIVREAQTKLLSLSEQKLKDAYDQFRQDVHSKKHTIGQTLFNINNLYKLLMIARRDGNGVVDDKAVIGRANPMAVSEIYDDLQISLNLLMDQVDRFDRAWNMKKEKIDVDEFIRQYIAEHQDPLYKIEYSSQLGILTANGTERAVDKIMFSRKVLSFIFLNIISNALSHGFMPKKEKGDNKILIESSVVGDVIRVLIKNNGLPIKSTMDEKSIFTYGVSSNNDGKHSGIGGSEVYNMMREFGGAAHIISTPDEEYTVTYQLDFKKII